MDLNLPYGASNLVKEAGSLLPAGDVGTLVLGVLLTLVAIIIVFVAKRVLENAVIGTAGFLILKFALGVDVPLLPGLIISLLFGLGGLGVLLLLHFFGLL